MMPVFTRISIPATGDWLRAKNYKRKIERFLNPRDKDVIYHMAVIEDRYCWCNQFWVNIKEIKKHHEKSSTHS